MLDAKTLLGKLKQRIPNMEIGECIDIRPFKRDRSVVIARLDEEEFLVLTNGFKNKELKGNLKSTLSALKKVLREEFPRSNKIRLYNMGTTDPYEANKLQR